jgi:hypothetical protein
MNDSLWRRARDIFEQAIEMDESRQMTFVRQACGADHSLLAEVKKMIAGDQRSVLRPARDSLQKRSNATFRSAAIHAPPRMPRRDRPRYRHRRHVTEGGWSPLLLSSNMNQRREQ